MSEACTWCGAVTHPVGACPNLPPDLAEAVGVDERFRVVAEYTPAETRYLVLDSGAASPELYHAPMAVASARWLASSIAALLNMVAAIRDRRGNGRP